MERRKNSKKSREQHAKQCPAAICVQKLYISIKYDAIIAAFFMNIAHLLVFC